jgi:2,5-furandicarboxylate decarboxylase 1
MMSLQECLQSKVLNEQDVIVIRDEAEIDFVPTALVLELEKAHSYPVVIIQNPRGYDIPVVCNLFASRERVARLLGAHEQPVHELWKHAELNRVKPIIVPGGPVSDVVLKGSDVDLTKIPIARHFQGDAGPYISSGIVIAKDPDTGVRNLSYHRLQLKDRNKLGVSLHSRGDLWDYYRRSEDAGRSLEVAVVIGAHPAVYLAASTKTPIDVDELDIAGGLLGEPVPLVKCDSVDVEVPANAEIVLEGRILADVREPEGPFGEYTGYSTSRSTQNVLMVDAVRMQERPVYLDVIPGYSSDHLLLSRIPRECRVFSRLKEESHYVQALNYPKSGTHYHAYVSIRKTAEGQAKQALLTLMGLDPYIKLAVAVDEDIDVYNEEEVLWAIATRVQADKRSFLISGALCNKLDPSSEGGVSAKVGIDATQPLDWDVKKTTLPKEAYTKARGILEQVLQRAEA